MSSRHRRTLEAVFRDPVSATIVWMDVEKMLVHHGAVITQRVDRVSPSRSAGAR